MVISEEMGQWAGGRRLLAPVGKDITKWYMLLNILLIAFHRTGKDRLEMHARSYF